jgi:hypothetical protein
MFEKSFVPIMKKIILISLLISFAAILFAAPQIKFKESKHDFGAVKEEDGPITYIFEFTNTGDAPLKLEKVKAS